VVQALFIVFFFALLCLDGPFPDPERVLLLLRAFLLLSLNLLLAGFAVGLAAFGRLVVVERQALGDRLTDHFLRRRGLPVHLDEGSDEVFVAGGD